MRSIFPFAHKYLWLAPPPSRPFDLEPSARASRSSKVAPIERFETAVPEKKNYAELVKKVRLFQAQVIGITDIETRTMISDRW